MTVQQAIQGTDCQRGSDGIGPRKFQCMPYVEILPVEMGA